jgi:hypothetical protein
MRFEVEISCKLSENLPISCLGKTVWQATKSTSDSELDAYALEGIHSSDLQKKKVYTQSLDSFNT